MASTHSPADRSAIRSDLSGTSETVRTPGPLSFEQGFILANGEALKVVGVQIPMVVGAARLEAIANAAFIVRACNAHDDLVATLKIARTMLITHGGDPRRHVPEAERDNIQASALDYIEAALSKATGEA